jgi:hypothetical protein
MNNGTPVKAYTMITTLDAMLVGTISPYPMVDIEATAK